MEQRMRKDADKAFYLNLESAALSSLDIKDSVRLDRVIEAMGARTLYFDEVQQLKGWERYVRSKLDEELSATRRFPGVSGVG